MTTLLDGSIFGGEVDSARAQKLSNARKKLKSFRATRSTDTTLPAPLPLASRPTPSVSLSIPIPLTTDLTGNTSPSPTAGPSKTKNLEANITQPIPKSPRSPGKLRKARSKGSMSHRRQNSSISGAGGFGRANGDGMSLFDEGGDYRPMRAELPRVPPSEIITTPATPLMLDLTNVGGYEEEDRVMVKERLSTFSFGAKSPNARSPSPRERIGQPLLPSQAMNSDRFPSPSPSPIKSLATPSSRPPSLLLTRPTPLQFGSPSPAGPSSQAESPQTPPTPARTKRHSHTRSNSISLPNLKLSSRPTSLGVSNSPSFPSSPSSPMGASRPSSLYQGARLKFEPSGRGAEAEKEKEEYRRKALEKLTGSPSPVFPDSPSAEIALPDLDDEDNSSVASSARPVSGFGSFTFGRPNSSSSTPSGFSWSTNEDSPPLERWSTGFNAKQDDKEDALGFGFTFSGSGSGSFSFGQVPPPPPASEYGIGKGLPSTMSARPSLTRNLSVLAEVDEPEDNETEADVDGGQDVFILPTTDQGMPMSPLEEEEHLDTTRFVPIVAPAPTRLRELHLVSSVTPVSVRPPLPVNATSQGSPTKGYGAIGRGRPAPLEHIITDSPVSLASLVTTPKSAGLPRRRAAPGSGSRGSSISYKKDNESSTSSRDWSFSSKAPFSPPSTHSDLTSPPPTLPPHFSGWGNLTRTAASRPCPRPKSLAGMGVDHQGAGRILGELEEVDEDALSSSRNTSFRLASAASTMESSDNARESFDDYAWREMHLEIEMERDALREDVDLWRVRCGGLEDKLEAEKKENGVLRERVRKLGDRLSAVSSYPVTNNRDASLVADLRTQLFGLQVDLDRERNQRISATDRIAELEAQLSETSIGQDVCPPVITNVIPATPLSPNARFAYPSPALTSPSNATPSPDPTSRMRGWGFPRGPITPSTSRSKNRESFFGLSQVLRRDSTNDEAAHGLDLPPFLLSPESHTSEMDRARTVSDPTPKAQPRALDVYQDEMHRSTSLTSSASSALSFLTDYLPKYTRPISPSRPKSIGSDTASRSSKDGPIKRLPNSVDRGHVDMRHGCSCCTGEVIDL